MGVVDSQRLLSESALGREASARLKKLSGQKGDEIEKLAMEIRQIERTINDKTRSTLEKAYAQKAIAYKRLQEDAKRDLEAAEKRELSELERRISPVITQFGKTNGYTLIMNKSTLVHADDAVDVTDEVLTALNRSVAFPAAQTSASVQGSAVREAAAPPRSTITSNDQSVEFPEDSEPMHSQAVEDLEESEPDEPTSWADSPFMKAVDQGVQQSQQFNKDLAERNRREKERARAYLAQANETARQQQAAEARARMAALAAQDAQTRAEAQTKADAQAKAEAQAKADAQVRADAQARARANAQSNAPQTDQQKAVPPTSASAKDTSGVSVAHSSLDFPVNTGNSCEPCNPTGGCPTRWDQAVHYSIRNPYGYSVRVHVTVSVQTGSRPFNTVNPIINVGPGQTASDTQSFYTACDFYAPNPNTRYQVQVTRIDAE
jgi:Skp family chaperone for outer membrane proteins